jgi:hypothetical protein
MATDRKSTSTKSNAGKSTKRRTPGSGGQGEYYHIEVRPRKDFVAFRTQDVGDPGHIQRVAGQRESGSWATVKWLVSKEEAHIQDDQLVGDTRETKDLIKKLGAKPILKRGNLFEAKPRKNVAERTKPTSAQKKARSQNIKKAQSAARKSK